MVNADDYFSGDYINAEKLKSIMDLQRPLLVSEVKTEMINEQPKLKISFEGIEESLIVNKTNYLDIKEVLGNETDKWIGAKITLKLSNEMFQGKKVPAVRIAKVITA